LQRWFEEQKKSSAGEKKRNFKRNAGSVQKAFQEKPSLANKKEEPWSIHFYFFIFNK